MCRDPAASRASTHGMLLSHGRKNQSSIAAYCRFLRENGLYRPHFLRFGSSRKANKLDQAGRSLHSLYLILLVFFAVGAPVNRCDIARIAKIRREFRRIAGRDRSIRSSAIMIARHFGCEATPILSGRGVGEARAGRVLGRPARQRPTPIRLRPSRSHRAHQAAAR